MKAWERTEKEEATGVKARRDKERNERKENEDK